MEELPLLGLGHSLGALMQVLLCCTYAEYSESCRAAAYADAARSDSDSMLSDEGMECEQLTQKEDANS